MTERPAREPKPAVSDELRAEMKAKAEAAVATWPPLTADQLAEIRRILGPDLAPTGRAAS